MVGPYEQVLITNQRRLLEDLPWVDHLFDMVWSVSILVSVVLDGCLPAFASYVVWQPGRHCGILGCGSKPTVWPRRFASLARVMLRATYVSILTAGPLVRVKVKFTAKFPVCESLREQHTAFLTVNLALTRTNGAARTRIGKINRRTVLSAARRTSS